MPIETVVVLNDHANVTGGQAKVAIDSACALARRGVHVVFFAPCGPPDPALARAGVEIVCLGQQDILADPVRTRAALRGLWNVNAARALQALLARVPPARSVIHCHGFAKALSPSIGPILADARLPVVYTMHEYFLACPNGGFFDHARDEICTRKPLGADCLTTRCDARSSFHKGWRVLRQAVLHGPGRLPNGLRDVIALSETQITAMRPHLPSHVRLHRLDNPVDVTRAPPVAISDTGVALFVGRVNAEKGPTLFAEAARRAGVPALIVGDGPERPAIEANFPEVEIVGWADRAGLRAAFSRARCLVFSSLWYECQPLVPLEALASGVPVIAGSWTAAAEAVRASSGGIVVDTPSAQAFSDAIARVENSAGRAGYDWIWARNDGKTEGSDRHVEGLLNIYQQMQVAA